MSTLLTKYWWYKPNRYTTTFTLTATFGDSTSEYVFNKIGESWEAVGTHDSRLVIILPNANNGNRFIVRAYDNDVFVSLNAEYSNAYSQSIAKPANMSRMVFDKSFYSTHLFEPNCAYDNPYDLFNDSDLHDIYFTNLTETITLPNKNSNYGHWYGWGAYNQTKPYSMLNKINDLDNLYRMPLSWIYSWQLAGFPTVGINNSTSSHPGISKFYEVPMVDHRVYMVPLYHNEKPYYDIDTKDYGEPVIPDTPTPPTPSEPDYLCFTANKAGATLRLIGMVNPDYDGDLVELEYSTDGETWHDFEITTDLNSDPGLNSISSTLTFSNIGDKVYFRGNNILGTSAVYIENGETNFTYVFAGGEGTNTEDNEFAVSGDIQTIVDKTGQDKTHGQFGGDEVGLFSNLGVASDDEFPGILITTAPDLTATSLVPGKYCYLFMGQTLLEHPATMPNFTTNQLPHMSMDDMNYGAYVFMYMYYGCTSLQEGCDFSTLTANTYSDVLVIAGNLAGIYAETTFNITDDNGLTLNGFEGISFPFTATMEMDGETMTEVVNSYMFASEMLSNTNGFSTTTLYISTNNGYINDVNPYYSYENDYNTHVCEISIPSSEVDTTIEVEFAPNDDYTVTKWQSSTDGETWTDIPNSDSNTLEITIPDTDYYYKVVTISTNPNWVETSRTLNTSQSYCETDGTGTNTGYYRQCYDIVEEDQNPNSSTYGQTRTYTQDYGTTYDTVTCPLVNTQPNWVEVSREVAQDSNNVCYVDEYGMFTGECIKTYNVLKEDTNQYSQSYGQQQTFIETGTTTDGVACPIPTTSEVPFHLEVYTEYDDNGTIITNNSDKFTIDLGVYRHFGANSYSMKYPNNSTAFANRAKISTYGNTIKLADNDTLLLLEGNITCVGCIVTKCFTRASSNAAWEEQTVPAHWSESTQNLYIGYFTTSANVESSGVYCDIKFVLEPAIKRHITGNLIFEYEDNGSFYSLNPQQLNGPLIRRDFTIRREQQSRRYNPSYGTGIDTNVENGIDWSFGVDVICAATESVYFKADGYIDPTAMYEVYEEYRREQGALSFTQIELGSWQLVDSSNWLELKCLFRPARLELNINVAQETIVDGQSTYTIDNSLVSNNSSYYVGASTSNTALQLGSNYFTLTNDSALQMHVSCTLPQTSQNILQTVKMRTSTNYTYENTSLAYSSVDAITGEQTLTYEYHFSTHTDDTFRYPSLVDVLFILPESNVLA